MQEALVKGATSVDTIVLRLEKVSYNNPPLQNVLDVFARTTDFMLNQIANDDLIISQLEAENNNVHVNFYFINKELTTRSFIFNKEEIEISIWWQEGLELFKTTECKSHILKAKTLKI